MTAREYLGEIAYIRYKLRYIKKKISELDEEMTTTGAIRYDKDRVQTTPANRHEDKIIKLVDIKKKYESARVSLENDEIQMLSQIDGMPNKTHAKILRLRFFDLAPGDRLHTIGWIADEMGYAEDYVRHQYQDALKGFEEKYLTEKKKTQKSTEN